MRYWYVVPNIAVVSVFLLGYWWLYLRVQKLERWANEQKKIEKDKTLLFGDAAESITQVLEGLTKIADEQKAKLVVVTESKSK